MDVTGRTTGTQNFQNMGAGSNRGTLGDTTLKNSNLSSAASDLLKDGKKVANELYEEGRHRVNEMQDSIRVYSDELIKQVHTRPMTTLLIAAGVGFILASFIRR
ncbi:hypothetical protein [Legionella gresilensis]|uniref:hypothetical protein n=1 Tax=Legionella gresilensis TaxID=91823 RepID=UPI0010414337|nr:hypothetical protein [Legionella gresilensis]